MMWAAHARANRAQHFQPDEPDNQAPCEPNDDHDERQEQYHLADASKLMTNTDYERPQSIADGIANPDCVRHEEHRSEEVPD